MFKRYQFPLVAVLCGSLGLGLALGAAVNALADDAGVVEAGSGTDAAPTPAPAPATEAPTLPDPVADPIGAGSEIYKLYKSGGLVPAIIVGLFLLVTFLYAKVKWLQSGYRALAVAGTLGALAILVEPASRGTTPTLAMTLAAIGTGLALAFKMDKLKPAATEA